MTIGRGNYSLSKSSRRRRDAGEILTDGVGVSIVLKKSKKSPDGDAAKKLKKQKTIAAIEPFDVSYYGQVWGVDPGRRDLFVAADVENNTLHCSSQELYHDAKYKESVRKNRKWTDKGSSIRGMPQPKNRDALFPEAVRRLPPAETGDPC